eukprot:m.507750 g.507750  ORF g.507750 m.507750 type:complete len:63 (+) comp57387_c0_seq9:926-1114(+)
MFLVQIRTKARHLNAITDAQTFELEWGGEDADGNTSDIEDNDVDEKKGKAEAAPAAWDVADD